MRRGRDGEVEGGRKEKEGREGRKGGKVKAEE